MRLAPSQSGLNGIYSHVSPMIVAMSCTNL